MPNSFLGQGLIGVDIPSKGGRAVIATQTIPPGSLLVVFGGDVLTREEVEALPSDLRRLVLQVDEGLFLFSRDEGPADWINHSCEPNAGLRGQICLVALKTIEPGEEITFDYAMSDGCDYDEFDCQCGAERCRGRVSGEDWRRPDLIARYRGYRSPYLDFRLKRLKGRGRTNRFQERSRRVARRPPVIEDVS
jgi:hypothetical protein